MRHSKDRALADAPARRTLPNSASLSAPGATPPGPPKDKNQRTTHMAIFSLSFSTVQRSKGSSAVSSASYIEDRTMYDERLGAKYRYGSDKSKKHQNTICLGSKLPDGREIDTQTLWNVAEARETRKNSQTARKLITALPIELPLKEQIELMENFRSFLAKEYSVATTIAIHREHESNPHAHIMFTTRKVSTDGELTDKLRIFNDKSDCSKQVELIRERWASLCNDKLKTAGLNIKIDHRSLERQGITDRLPQIHYGAKSKAIYLKNKNLDPKDKTLTDRLEQACDRELININTKKIHQRAKLLIAKLNHRRKNARKSLYTHKYLLATRKERILFTERLKHYHTRQINIQLENEQRDNMIKQLLEQHRTQNIEENKKQYNRIKNKPRGLSR